MSKNTNFGEVNVDAKNSAVNIGVGNMAINKQQHTQLQELTAELLKYMRASDLPVDSQRDIESAVRDVTNQVEKGNLKKQSILETISSIGSAVRAVSDASSLIASFDKWKKFILGLFD